MLKTKVNRINIYLTNTDRKKLNEMKYKYHLSYSSIANVITNILTGELKANDLKTYIYEDKNTYKTSIKPRDGGKILNKTIVYTNCIKVFIRGELIRFMNEEKAVKIECKIINELKETFDENWDGNRLNRQIPRILKKNRDYCKKILELE